MGSCVLLEKLTEWKGQKHLNHLSVFDNRPQGFCNFYSSTFKPTDRWTA